MMMTDSVQACLRAFERKGRAAHAEGIVAFAAVFDGRVIRIAGFWDPAPA